MEDFTDGGLTGTPPSSLANELRWTVALSAVIVLGVLAPVLAMAGAESSPTFPMIGVVFLAAVVAGGTAYRILMNKVREVLARVPPAPILPIVAPIPPASKPMLSRRYCEKHGAFLGAGRHYCGYCSEEECLSLLKDCRRTLLRNRDTERREFTKLLSSEITLLSLRHPCCNHDRDHHA